MGAIGMAFSDHMLVISFQPCDLSLHGPCLEVHFPCRCSIWFYSFDAGFEKSDDKMDMEEWVTKVWARSEDRNENCVLGELQ